MKYLMTGTIRSHLDKNQRMGGFARRAEWKYPQGMKVIGEWWQAVAPQVVAAFETDSYDPILAMQVEWSDFMEITISPATTPEEGLASAQKLMKK